MTQARGWALTAGLAVFGISLLAASHWPVFPYFLDSYYHLSVIQGFKQAGGWVLHSFWEAAPQGRPHLYPPLFHLLFVPALEQGLDPIELARFWSWVSFPLLLLTAWIALRRLSAPRPAALSLIALATPYSFYLGSINHVPATLSLICCLGIAWAIMKKRFVSGGILLGISFWLHAGLPILIALGVLLFGMLEKPLRKTALGVLSVGAVVAAPVLLHLARHLGTLQFGMRGQDRLFETPILMLLLGVASLGTAWRKQALGRFFLYLGVAFLPMAFLYPARFWGMQGLFPWLILAGLTLDSIWEKVEKSGRAAALLAGLLLGALALGSPGLHVRYGKTALAWADTTGAILSGANRHPIPRSTDQPLFSQKLMSELSREITAHTQADELFFCNTPYIAGMMTSLTGRASTNEILSEQPKREWEAQIKPAKVILWVQPHPDKGPEPKLQELALQYRLRPLAKTDLAWIYFNDRAQGKRVLPKTVLPWGIAWVGFLLLLGGAAYDLSRR